MNTIKMEFDTPIELGYYNSTIELEIIYISAGIVNILQAGRPPDMNITNVIEENYTAIVDAVISEQTRLAWEIREKAWDIPEKKPYSEIEYFITNMNDVQREIGG